MPTVLIFGASRGLGRALVEEHLKRGWHVIATVRQSTALDDLVSDALTVETFDITDWIAVDALLDRLEEQSFDMLFVNAAIIGPSSGPIGDADPDDFTQMMLTNVLAPLRIADRFARWSGPTGRWR